MIKLRNNTFRTMRTATSVVSLSCSLPVQHGFNRVKSQSFIQLLIAFPRSDSEASAEFIVNRLPLLLNDPDPTLASASFSGVSTREKFCRTQQPTQKNLAAATGRIPSKSVASLASFNFHSGDNPQHNCNFRGIRVSPS